MNLRNGREHLPAWAFWLIFVTGLIRGFLTSRRRQSGSRSRAGAAKNS